MSHDDIAIVDLDLKKTTWSRVHSSMRTLYLKLSADPDLDWIRFFREERESRIEVKRHGLWIEDGYIVFDCLIADVETHHLPDLRRSLAYANEKHRALKATRRSESRRHRDAAEDEERRLAALKALIRTRADRSAAPAIAETTPAVRPASTPTRARAAATASDPRFTTKRNELRTRLRAALKTRTKESDRGND